MFSLFAQRQPVPVQPIQGQPVPGQPIPGQPSSEQPGSPSRRNRKIIYAGVLFAIACALLMSYYYRDKSIREGASGSKFKRANDSVADAKEEEEEEYHGTEEDLLKLAKRIKAAGIKIYGVTPCGWTRKQREMFGSRDSQARKVLESVYVECRSPDMCPGVMGYPTWKHKDEQFPGYKDVAGLNTILNKIGSTNVPKKVALQMPAVPEEDAQEEVLEQPRPAKRVEIVEVAEEEEEEEEEEVKEEEEEEEPKQEPVVEKKVVKKPAVRRSKPKVEKARGVSAYAPLAVPDMPGTAVFEPSGARLGEQVGQGNVPRESLENNDPVASVASQFVQSYEHIARNNKRDGSTASVNHARLPQSSTVSTGDAFADKRLPVEKRAK